MPPKGKRKNPLVSKVSAKDRLVYGMEARIEKFKALVARKGFKKVGQKWETQVFPEIMDMTVRASKEATQEKIEAQRQEMKLMRWRRDLHKKVPSKNAIAFFEVRGEWQQNDDGTFTGSMYAPVTGLASRDYEAFQDWMMRFMEPAVELEEEPFWFGIGYTVGGLTRQEGKKYDKIRGRNAIVSHWFKTEEQVDRYGRPLRGSDGHVLLRRALGYVRVVFEHRVAANVFARGLTITSVTLLGHYGPTKPNLKIE